MKNSLKRIVSLAIVALLCVGMLALPAYAAQTSLDGLSVTLTTDKDVYGKGETIVATLTVKNTNSFAVSDVSLESLVPTGYVSAGEDQIVLKLDELAAGETATLTVRFVAEQKEEPTTAPTTATDPTKPTTNQGGQQPTTGDNAPMGLWIFLMLLAMAGLIVLVAKYNLWKRTLSLVLCGALLASLVAGVPFGANAAEAEEKSLDISTTVQVDGKPLELRATVKYGLPVEMPAVHTVKFDLDYEDAPQIEDQQVVHGECAAQPEGVVREGYTFAYWALRTESGLQMVDLTQPITEDMALYACWIKEGNTPQVNLTNYYRVTLGYPDDWTENDILATYLPEEQLIHEGALVYSLNTPVREGYNFSAWYYDSAMTQQASPEDVITADTVLYPLMLKDSTENADMPTDNYVAVEDVSGTKYRVTVRAPSRQAALDGLVWLDITAGGTTVDFTVTDNYDGTYTVENVEPLEGGKTYQLRAMDRDQIPTESVMNDLNELYIRFYYNGELQSKEVCYYNIFTTAEEVNNMHLAGGIIFIPADQVQGIDMEVLSNLFSVETGEDGKVDVTTNDHEGSFRYTGSKTLAAGDIVAFYEGDPAVEEEYQTHRTAAKATSTAFLEIVAVAGDSYAFRTPELFDVMFFPDVLPIPLSADTDGDAGNGSITVSDSYLDFRHLAEESQTLDENTVVEPGDFIAFYNGTLEDPTDISYGKILTVEGGDGVTTITFASATVEDMENALDSYIRNPVSIDLEEEERVLLENQIIRQGLDSGFAEEAAALAVKEKLDLEEIPVWGESYTVTSEQYRRMAKAWDPEVDVEHGEIDFYTMQFRFDKPNVSADVTDQLRKITKINNGEGLRATFGVYVPIGIEMVNPITGNVEQSLKLDLYVTMEQEIAFDIAVKVDGGVDLKWDFWNSDAWMSMNVVFDIGNYTGVGAVAMIDTEKHYQKEYIWNELVNDKNNEGAFTSAASLAEQLNSMLSQGNTSFFDQYRDEEGNSTLVEEYQSMLKNESDYMDILSIPLPKFKGYITPTTPVAQYVIAPELVLSAKMNALLGISFETMIVKQYSYGLYVSLSDGARAWANPEVDKQTPYHNFNMLMMGVIGLRGGIRLSASIGLGSVKLANVGMMIELGIYVELYGFGYYHYDWSGETKTGNTKSAGAYYIEAGFYIDLDLFANALMDVFTVDFHLLELKHRLFSWGQTQYIYDVDLVVKEHSVHDASYNDRRWFRLNDWMYRVKIFDIKCGEMWTSSRNPSQFTLVIPEEYRDKVDYVAYDPNGNLVQQFYLWPDREQKEMDLPIQVVLTESMNKTRSAGQGGLYELIGSISDTLTIKWSRGLGSFKIMYEADGPVYYDYGAHWYSSHPGNNYVTVTHVREGTILSDLSYIDRLAPEVQGMRFAGWEIYCYGDETLNGKFIQSAGELKGMAMPVSDFTLNPKYVPGDTEYTVRHFVTSLEDPEQFELFREEIVPIVSHSTIDALDHYLYDISGLEIDVTRLPVQYSFTYDAGGQERLYMDFTTLVRPDGGTVIELYYQRESCRVSVSANNPEWSNISSVPPVYVNEYQYGEAVVDPGYAQTVIPGYTFMGWSTTADGSSGILDALPDSLDFTDEQLGEGIVYYAIWEADEVACKINYYLLGVDGEYRLLDTEVQVLPYGTELYLSNLEPEIVELPENAYGNSVSAATVVNGVKQAYTGKLLSYIDGYYDVDVFYIRFYTRVGFRDKETEFYIRGETLTMPAAEKVGYRFLGWKSFYASDEKLYQPGETIELNKQEYFFYPVFTEADDVKYTVEHYLEDLDGGYYEMPEDVDVFYGTTGSLVVPDVKEYTGFIAPATRSLQIKADGSAVLAYYYKRQSFEVKIDMNAGEEDLILRGRYTPSYKFGAGFALMDPYNDPLTIYREGYRIIGWYLADEALNPDQTLLTGGYWVSGEAVNAQKDLVFSPMWEKIPYEYSTEHYLQQLDGSYVIQQTDKSTAYLNDEVRAKAAEFVGFTFDEANGDNVLSCTVTTDGSLVLKLNYTRNSYEVKWYAYDGATVLATTLVKYKDTITPPETYEADTTRRGYTLTGWKESDYGRVTTAGASFTAADHGLWTANSYTVTFQANGGEGTMDEQGFAYDEAQSLIANGFTRPGYSFAGWSYSPTGSAVLTDGEQVENLVASGTVTLFAIWKAEINTPYVLEHYGQTLEGGWALLDSEHLVGITDTTATAVAATFHGFLYDADADNVLQGNIAGDGSLVLKLYYRRNSYTLSWLDYDGKELASQSILFEAPIVAPSDVTPSRTGYTFLGWNASGTMPAEDTSFSADKDGNWAANTYTVSFDSNGGQGTMEAQSFTYDQAQLLKANGFTRKGYIFAGWSTESGGQVVYTDQQQIENLAVSGNVQLYAVWTAGDGYAYQVEHYVQQPDGSYQLDTTASFSGVMDSEVSASSIRIQGYTFNADHPDNILSGRINAEGTLVLKLHYDLRSYTATLVDDNGTQLASWTVPYGAAVTVPADAATPVREGYTFGSWADLGTMPAEDRTYSVADYGTWKANTYTVTFDANGGEGKMDDQSFTYDKAQKLSINSFTKTGYTFVGWSLSVDGEVKYADQAQVSNLAASGNVTLYAKWEASEASYKVVHYGEKLDGTGFEEIKTENLTGRTDVTVSAEAITLEGFTYDASNSSNVTSGIVTGDDSLVLELYYTRNSYTLTLDFNGESMKQSTTDGNTGLTEITDFDIPDRTFTVKYGQSLAEFLTDIKISEFVEDGYWDWDEELQDYVYIDTSYYEEIAFETAYPGYTFGSWEGICDTMPGEDLTLTARWDPIMITVTFHPGSYDWFNGDLAMAAVTETFAYGTEIVLPDYFAMEGCVITGWFFGESQWNYPFIVEKTLPLVYGYYSDFYEGTELTIAPFWVRDYDVATITFNGNGGEGSMDPLLFHNGSGYQCGFLPRNGFTKEGYEFAGWTTTADGSGEEPMWDWFEFTGDTTLYAQWKLSGEEETE